MDRPTRDLARAATWLVCLAGAAIAIGVTTERFLDDGSFWLDEAAIARNLLYRGPTELFGRLETDHRFPRVYLSAIRLLQEGTGYGTLSARFLPYSAFVAGALVYAWAIRERFARLPFVALAALALVLLPGTWLAYGAMLKQYSLDACVAVLPLLWSDRLLEGLLRDRRRSIGLLALVLPCLFSFTYVIPLLGRVLAHVAWKGARRERPFAAIPGLVFGLGLATALGVAYAVDLRYATLWPHTERFFGHCMLGSGAASVPATLRGFLFGWFSPGVPHGTRPDLHAISVALLGAALALGSLAIVARWLAPLFGRHLPRDPDPDLERWGSRSLASLAVLVGAPLASFVVGYPICPGRLSLFAYFHLVLVIAEGLAGPILFGRRGLLAAHGLGLLIGAQLVSPAWRNVHFLVTEPLQEDVRPLLPRIAAHPDWPIAIPPCSTEQIETLPEWLGRDDLFYAAADLARGGDGYPDAPEYWLLSVGAGTYCPWYPRTIVRQGGEISQQGRPGRGAALFRVRRPLSSKSGDRDE